MKKATKVFARKKISFYDLPQRRAQKDPKTSKTIILNLDKGYLCPPKKAPGQSIQTALLQASEKWGQKAPSAAFARRRFAA